jgi:hypothetical protein
LHRLSTPAGDLKSFESFADNFLRWVRQLFNRTWIASMGAR